MKKIITISREFGAGAGEIGQKLAAELGYEYYDKELILMAAAKSNLDTQSLIDWDEKVPVNFGFTQSLFDFYNKPLSDKIFSAQKKVIREIAEKGNCVIVGRNANYILKEFDHCLHVFIHADFPWRLNRMKHKMEVSSETQASEKIKEIDKARIKYCSFYTNTMFGDESQYDITLNSSRLGIDKCYEVILNLSK